MLLYRTIASLLLIFLVASVNAGGAAPEDTAYSIGESLYEFYGCSSCHGAAGKDALPGTPMLDGQDETYLVNQLKDFRSGARTNGMSQIMIGSLNGVTDEEIGQLSRYLAKQ